MSEYNKVTIDSKLTVVSSRPVKSGKIHKLSTIDHAMSSHTLHLIFYYNNHDKWFGSFELDPLRESLSKVLSLYPTITGRLVRKNDDWEVSCNDAGIRVIKANVDTTIDEWLSSSSSDEFDETQLIAWDDMPHDPTTWSPFRIQINSFKEGGVAIGLSCSHMLADLTCASSFFKTWTQIHTHFPISHPPFFIPLITSSSPSLPNNINIDVPIPVPNSPSKPATKKVVTATFKFPSSTIKESIFNIQNTICSNVTPFDFLSALFWTRVTHSKLPSSIHNQTHSLSICRDFRKLIKPSLPIGYFGNALYFSNLSVKEEEMKSGEVGDIASLIHRHLKDVTEEEIWSYIEWFESQKETEKGKFRTSECIYGSDQLTCVCMEEEETASLLYESMFCNSEKPAHVSCRIGNVDSEGLIMVMPSSEGGLARTVIVMLMEEDLDKLCNDQEILKLEPTIKLARCRVQL